MAKCWSRKTFRKSRPKAKNRSFSITAISIEGWAIKQIALPLRLDRQYSFDNYLGSQAEFIVDRLHALICGSGETQLGLWGQPASGKTHLLNASASFARERGINLQLYDAEQLVDYAARDFTDFDCEVLAIDNLDAIAGMPDWETCFYQLVNRCREQEFRLLFSLRGKPEEIAFKLADLQSRLQWGLLLQLPLNDDDEVRLILRQRARMLGFDLSAEVIAYLMTHHSRNLATQMAILKTLDGASLAHKRRITIPLIKKALDEQAGYPG